MGECGRLESRSWDDIRVMGIFIKKMFQFLITVWFSFNREFQGFESLSGRESQPPFLLWTCLSSSVTNLEGERGHDGALLQSLSLLSASLASDIITASNVINIWNYLF